jgi:hypothetical protein
MVLCSPIVKRYLLAVAGFGNWDSLTCVYLFTPSDSACLLGTVQYSGEHDTRYREGPRGSATAGTNGVRCFVSLSRKVDALCLRFQKIDGQISPEEMFTTAGALNLIAGRFLDVETVLGISQNALCFLRLLTLPTFSTLDCPEATQYDQVQVLSHVRGDWTSLAWGVALDAGPHRPLCRQNLLAWL